MEGHERVWLYERVVILRFREFQIELQKDTDNSEIQWVKGTLNVVFQWRGVFELLKVALESSMNNDHECLEEIARIWLLRCVKDQDYCEMQVVEMKFSEIWWCVYWNWITSRKVRVLELFRVADVILLAYDVIISEWAGIQVGQYDRVTIFRQVRISRLRVI